MNNVTIPPMNESDRDRDPAEDYEYGLKLMRVPSSALHAWIRRAVAAEAERERLKSELRGVLDACRGKVVRLEPTDDDDVFDEVTPPWWTAANTVAGR